MRPSPRASRALSPERIHRLRRRCKGGPLRSRRSRSTILRARGATSRAASPSGTDQGLVSGAVTMLESAEVGHAISKAAYAHEEPRLREALLNAQFDLSQTKKGPVLLIISGVEGG